MVVQRKSGRSNQRRKPRGRAMSARQRAIYRRRRITVASVLLIALALVVFCGYSIARGIGAIGDVMNHGEIYAISRSSVPAPAKTGGVRDCGEGTVSLSLTAAAQSVPVAGSLDFTATIAYTGSAKAGCLVDGSNAGRVLTISSGDKTVWRSDSCPVDSRMLLMGKGDEDRQQITWNANATGSECQDDAALPKVNAGTYTARLSLRDQPKVTSDPVTITVQ